MEIGFIGLGAMGAPMASNLIRAGFSTCIYDVRAEAMAALTVIGGKPAQSPRMVAACSDAVFIMVNDEHQIRALLEGEDGLVAGARPGVSFIIQSTVSPAFCRMLAQELALKNIEVIDAPVSGLASRAVEGTLSIFVGTAPARLERLRPVMQAMGRSIFHAGPVGAGQTVKIINNLIAITTFGALAEGLALSRACGVDEELMLDIINRSSSASFASQHWHENATARHARMDTGGNPWQMAAKDMDLALALGREARHMLPLAGLMSQIVDTI